MDPLRFPCRAFSVTMRAVAHDPDMTPAEITIITLVYVATLVLGQRATAFVLPDQQEVGFLIAGVATALVAGFMYGMRERRKAPIGVIFSAAAPMAVLALVVGMLTQLLWQPFVYPEVSLVGAAVVTLILPFLLFNIGRALAGERPVASEPVGITNIIMVGVFAVAAVIAAFMLPAPGHSSVRLYPQTFPRLSIALPDWTVEEKSTGSSAGSVRLADPAGGDHFLSVRWVESAPVTADEDIKGVAAALEMESRDRTPASVSAHEGVTFYLESADRNEHALATIWYCNTDHRLYRIVTKMLAPRASLLALQQRVIESVQCHSAGSGASTQAATVLPDFIPPPGYVPNTANPSLRLFINPRGQTIVFYPAVPGRHALVDAVVSPDQVATILKNTGALTSIDTTPPPRLLTTSDLLGHDRRIWSASGTNAKGEHLQVELMVWWCDRRDMTFLGAYATPTAHDPREGVNAMLPAVCHKE